MSKYQAYPPRLVELPGEQDPTGVAPLIRSAITAPGEDTPKVRWRIRDTLQRRVEKRSRLLRIAFVGASMFAAGIAIGAAGQPLWRAIASISSRPEATATPPVAQGKRRQAQVQTPTVAEAAGEQLVANPTAAVTETVAPGPSAGTLATTPSRPATVAPAPAVQPVSASVRARPQTASKLASQGPGVAQPVSAPVRAHPRAASKLASQGIAPAPPAPAKPLPEVPVPPVPPVPPPAPAPAPTVQPTEQSLVVAALGKLRSAHDPRGALVALDEHRRRFPAGSLAPEAARLRTEALLLLGQNATVLDELDRPASSGAPSADERLVLRGELRAAAGRWQAALADFDTVLGRHPTTHADSDDDQRTIERTERALWGRASARGHLGDDSGARRDLRDYLRRFPEGRFAKQAAHLLEERR